MLSFGNERQVQQGEDWNLDILLSQSEEEYIPFIVSSERQNPMFAITVASTKYEKNYRYVATWWQDLTNGEGFLLSTSEETGLTSIPLPRFYQTIPEYIGEIAPNTTISRPVNPSMPDGIDPPMYALYQYTKTDEEVDLSLGHKPYHYVYFTKEDPNTPKFDYECRVRMQFRSEETSQWGSQNYQYQITLVDTVSMADYINEAHEHYSTLQWPYWPSRDDPDWIKPIKNNNETSENYNVRLEASWREFRNRLIMSHITELFTFIKTHIPNWFQPDIDMDAPVGFISVPQVILPPTRLQVNNNLRTII